MITERLDSLLRELVNENLPCCSLHIARHGKILYEGYFGYADAQKSKHLGSEHIFRMASMSKIALYTTLMMLYDEGRLYLNDPIQKFFPEWKNMKRYKTLPDGTVHVVPVQRDITVRDVLVMSCGLPNYQHTGSNDSLAQKSMAKCAEPLWNRGYFSLREEIRAMSNAVLACEPGSHWMYGFSGELAAGLVEVICDKPANEVFKERLFDPLGMKDTGAIFFGDIPSRLVTLFAAHEDGSYAETAFELDKKHLPGKQNENGMPRLFSTGRDFTRLLQMLACGGVYDGQRMLSKGTIDMMRTNMLTPLQLADFRKGFNADYGYGFGVRTAISRTNGFNGSLGAFGWSGGLGPWCEVDPAQEMSIVYMHNLTTRLRNDEIHSRVRAAAYGSL